MYYVPKYNLCSCSGYTVVEYLSIYQAAKDCCGLVSKFTS